MVSLLKVLTALGALTLLACRSLAAPLDVPAVLTNPTDRGRAELLTVIRDALHGAPVTLADDALTRESELIIERVRTRDAQGRPLNGRILERPEHFRLVKSGSRCMLVHARTGNRTVLTQVECSPRPAATR